jgi:hypothetical protein
MSFSKFMLTEVSKGQRVRRIEVPLQAQGGVEVLRSRRSIALRELDVSQQLQGANVARIVFDHLGGLFAGPIQVPRTKVNHAEVYACILVSRLSGHGLFEQAGSFLGVILLSSKEIAHAS